MYKKKNTRKSSCLIRFLYLIILIAALFLIYKFIASWGSAHFEIIALNVAEKHSKSGEPIPGSILISLELENSGDEDGLFCLDLDNYIEARKMEGKTADNLPKVWYFTSEFYYPATDQWQALPNSLYWSGEKMTPGALEVNIPEKEIINLQLYLKNSRGWKIKLSQPDLYPTKIRVTLYQPSGSIAESRESEIVY